VCVCVCVMLGGGGGDVIEADLVLKRGYIPGEQHKFNTKFRFK